RPWSYAVLRLHRTVPAIEGGPTAVRPLQIHEIKHDGYRLARASAASHATAMTGRFPANWRMAAIGKWPIRFALINRGPLSPPSRRSTPSATPADAAPSGS